MLFDLLNFLILITALFVIITTNQVHALFCLISVFIQLTILLLFFYDLEFIPFLIVIVYIGAIAILFLFVVMMLDINVTSKTTNSNSIGFILTSLFLTYLFYQKQDFSIYFDTNTLFWTVDFDMLIDLSKLLNKVIPESDRYISLESDLSIEVSKKNLTSFLDLVLSGNHLDLPNKEDLSFESFIPVQLEWENLISVATDLEAISTVLYTDFSVPVLLASFVLLLAMIGAITLTLKQKALVKRQQIPSQNFRNFDHAIRKVY